MSRPIAGIDHGIVGVRDLESARRAFAHLGFALSPRGRHTGWGTANYCAMMTRGYIELLGIVDPARFTNNLDRFLETREGVLGLALASGDAAETARALAVRGVPVDGPKDLKRTIECPDGAVEPAFRLVHLPPEATPGAPAFVCQHLTPELVWNPAWMTHPNGAVALASMTGVVADPGTAALAHGVLFGAENISVRDGVVEVATGRGRLRLCAPDDLARLYPGIVGLPGGLASGLVGLRVAVADLAASAAYLNRAGVPMVRDGDTLLRVPPGSACGVALEFEPVS